mmetsp:Transcript_33849/g.95104  ORF Transcript_33849/g.95104 Transcript_33849/m.95104 type:complete len:287 (-) Transcript_33849:952-1812(-)
MVTHPPGGRRAAAPAHAAASASWHSSAAALTYSRGSLQRGLMDARKGFASSPILASARSAASRTAPSSASRSADTSSAKVAPRASMSPSTVTAATRTGSSVSNAMRHTSAANTCPRSPMAPIAFTAATCTAGTLSPNMPRMSRGLPSACMAPIAVTAAFRTEGFTSISLAVTAVALSTVSSALASSPMAKQAASRTRADVSCSKEMILSVCPRAGFPIRPNALTNSAVASAGVSPPICFAMSSAKAAPSSPIIASAFAAAHAGLRISAGSFGSRPAADSATEVSPL